MRIPLIQIAENIHRMHQRAQHAIDQYSAHQYVNRLIHFSWRAQKPVKILLPILDCHCYQSSLHVSFQVYRLKHQPDMLHAGKPGILTRWFRRWEKKCVTITIPAIYSGCQSKYFISVDEEIIVSMPKVKQNGATQ